MLVAGEASTGQPGDAETEGRTEPARRSISRLTQWVVRRPSAATFVIALAVRLVAAVMITAFHHGSLIPDESQYMVLGQQAANGHLDHAFWSGYGISLFHATQAFMIPLTALFWMFGTHRILGQLIAAVFGALTAALTTRLALEAVDRRWALCAGAIVAFLPSQILWSSVVLRESMIWAMLVTVALAVSLSARTERIRPLIAWTALAFGALVVLGFLRGQTAIVAAWALVPVTLVAGGERRSWRVAVAGAVMVAAPWVSSQGPAGWNLVTKAIPSLGTTRAYMSLDADSAFVPTPAAVGPSGTGPAATADCEGQSGGGAGAVAIASRQAGSTTEGNKKVDCIVDMTTGTAIVVNNSLNASLHAIPRGVVAFTARPFPWDTTARIELTAAKAETVLWVAFYVLAVIGLWVARRRLRIIAYPLLVSLLVTVVAAASQGNLGTAFRHRAQILWALALFAVIGASDLWARRATRAARSRS